MPPPTSKKGVQKLLGAVNYFGRFIANLSEKTKNLRAVLKHDSTFEWSGGHEKEWKYLCEALSTAPVLATFDTSKQSKVTADASSFTLGAALLQLHGEHWRPVAYALQLLAEAETRYAQIEKEALAVTFACERFRDFITGFDVIVDIDHRPLIAIAQKSLSDMPP